MQTDDVERNVLEVFHRIRKAMLANDADTLRDLVAEDYQGCDAGGQPHDRALMVKSYGPGGVTLDVFEVSEVEAKYLGSTALVSGVAVIRGSYAGEAFEHDMRFLDVYVHRDRSWQLIASQITDRKAG